MTKSSMDKAANEARRFLAAVKKVKVRTISGGEGRVHDLLEGPKECGAVRRASMDLTRALAEMRKCG